MEKYKLFEYNKSIHEWTIRDETQNKWQKTLWDSDSGVCQLWQKESGKRGMRLWKKGAQLLPKTGIESNRIIVYKLIRCAFIFQCCARFDGTVDVWLDLAEAIDFRLKTGQGSTLASALHSKFSAGIISQRDRQTAGNYREQIPGRNKFRQALRATSTHNTNDAALPHTTQPPVTSSPQAPTNTNPTFWYCKTQKS